MQSHHRRRPTTHPRLDLIDAVIRAAASAATNLGDQRDCCELQSLRVAPELRGAGLGVRLLTAAQHEARVCGCRQTVIFVHDFQPLALYERFGFEELARVTDFPTGSAAIWMRKPIDGSAPRDL
jgi:ribosomal protein S18 acetylase RimI-like enzyme